MNANKKNILFVDATGAGSGRRRFTRSAIGAGARSIVGVLESIGGRAKIVLAEEVIKNGFPFQADALFVSGMSMDKTAARKVISLWRRKQHGKVIIGGPISSEIEGCLLATKADVSVIGEGELTIKEIFESGFLESNSSSKVLRDIKGIAYYTPNSEIIVNPFRPYSFKKEFQSFQASTKAVLDYPNYFSAKVYVECVRGCSNFGGTKITLPDGRKCTNCGYCESNSLQDRANCPSDIPPGCGFCSVPSLFGPPRSREINSIVQEISDLLTLGVRRIVLSAPDFLDFAREELVEQEALLHPTKPAANEQKVEALLSQIHSLELIFNGKAWVEIENVKAGLFTEKIAQIIANYLPNSPFSIGCETGSEQHAQLIGRPSNPKETLRAVKIAHKYGLKAHVYFIHSLPGQTHETALETVELIHQMEPFIEKVTIYRFRPLPLSAFGDFPLPGPAIHNPDSQLIANAANEVNLRKKKDFVDQTVQVIISEQNIKDKTGGIGYILSGGPIVAVENAADKIGSIQSVYIEKAITEKLLLGRIIDN